MKSRITIEVDFENGNAPVLQIIQQTSDDVRDKLLQSFIQNLGHTSRWCRIEYKGNRSEFAPPYDTDSPKHCYHIIPVRVSELPEEINLMEALVKVDKNGASSLKE